MYCAILYHTVLYYTVQYSTVQYCTVLYCTIQYCTRQIFMDRDEALKYAINFDNIENWRNYRHLKNRAHRALTKDKKQLIKKQLDDENSSRDKWNTTKRILGWGKSAQPTIIIDRGIARTKPIEIANSLNFNFISKVTKLIRSIPKNKQSPYTNYQKIMIDKNCSFNLQPIGISDLRKLNVTSKTSRSAGMDAIPMYVIKKNSQKN